MVADETIVVADPWWDLRKGGPDEAAQRDSIREELLREVKRGHVLDGEQVEVIARCQHCDNVMIRTADRWAIVHLSYAKDERPPWPSTDLFGSAREAEEAASAHPAQS